MVREPVHRITQLDAWTVPFAEPNDDNCIRCVTLVRITDEAGGEGWGECVTLFTEASVACTALLREWRDLIVGLPATPESVRAAITERWWWYGGGGIASFARAGVDIAMWDLASRTREVSLVDALGGAVHENLPIFISSHAARANLDSEADRWAGWVDGATAAGVKVGFGKRGEANLGFDHDRDVDFMRRLRGALGDETKICIDLGVRNRWSVDEAVRRTRAFEEHDLYWIEEPLGPDNPHGYRTLKDSTHALIAYGEREWTVAGISRIADSHTVDVVGIDAGRMEGVTGSSDATALLASQGVQANAHAFSGPIIYAAGLALSLTSSACRQFEVTPLRNQLFDILGVPLPEAVGGKVSALPGPGLGISIDVDRVNALALER